MFFFFFQGARPPVSRPSTNADRGDTGLEPDQAEDPAGPGARGRPRGSRICRPRAALRSAPSQGGRVASPGRALPPRPPSTRVRATMLKGRRSGRPRPGGALSGRPRVHGPGVTGPEPDQAGDAQSWPAQRQALQPRQIQRGGSGSLGSEGSPLTAWNRGEKPPPPEAPPLGSLGPGTPNCDLPGGCLPIGAGPDKPRETDWDPKGPCLTAWNRGEKPVPPEAPPLGSLGPGTPSCELPGGRPPTKTMPRVCCMR